MSKSNVETIRLYRIETPCHEGPFSSSEDFTVMSNSHTAPDEMEIANVAMEAVDSGDCFYFFSDFNRLAEVFSIMPESTFRVVYVDVPCDLELVKFFCLQDYQVILDSDLYLNYFEQGKVVVCEDLTLKITIDD